MVAVDGGEGEDDEMLRILMKASLQMMQRIRVTEALAITFVIPNDSELCTAMVSKRRDYAEAVKQAGAGHTLGPPFPHLWLVLLKELEATASREEKAEHANNVKQLAARAETFNEPEDFVEHLSELTLAKMYKPDVKKSSVHCTPTSAMTFSKAMRAVGFKMLLGKAPMGGFERLISDALA